MVSCKVYDVYVDEFMARHICLLHVMEWKSYAYINNQTRSEETTDCHAGMTAMYMMLLNCLTETTRDTVNVALHLTKVLFCITSDKRFSLQLYSLQLYRHSNLLP